MDIFLLSIKVRDALFIELLGKRGMLIKSIFLATLALLLTGFSLPVENNLLVNPHNFIAQSGEEQLATDVGLIKQIVIEDTIREFQLSPEIQVEVPTIVVNSNYAMAGWVVEHVGGLLFLKRTASGWVILPGTGGGVPDVKHLVNAGIPLQVAQGFINYLNSPNK